MSTSCRSRSRIIMTGIYARRSSCPSSSRLVRSNRYTRRSLLMRSSRCARRSTYCRCSRWMRTNRSVFLRVTVLLGTTVLTFHQLAMIETSRIIGSQKRSPQGSRGSRFSRTEIGDSGFTRSVGSGRFGCIFRAAPLEPIKELASRLTLYVIGYSGFGKGGLGRSNLGKGRKLGMTMSISFLCGFLVFVWGLVRVTGFEFLKVTIEKVTS
jgi:hypothetical protein